MSNALDAVIADLCEAGYESVTRDEGYEAASGRVPLAPGHRRNPPTGWRRLVPRLYCDAGDPALVPDDLRAIVESHGFTVQAMGRDDATVTVVVSETGV